MNGHRAKAIRKEARNPKYYTKSSVTNHRVIKILKDVYYGKFGKHTEKDVV